MRIWILVLSVILLSSIVIAHSDDPILEHDHPLNGTMEDTGSNADKYFGARDMARDWMFTGYGIVIGAFGAWLLSRWYYNQ